MSSTKIATKPSFTTTAFTDFRTATITQHWNDPPQQIFHKHADTQEPLDTAQIISILNELLGVCKEGVVLQSEKRVIADTEKRIGFFSERLSSGEISERVVGSVGQICKYLQAKDFTNALEAHNHLMHTDFESEGKWILGFRRLIDLYRKATLLENGL